MSSTPRTALLRRVPSVLVDGRSPRSGRGVHLRPQDNAEWPTVLTVELIVLSDVVYAVVDGIRRFRFFDCAVFVPRVVDEATAKFGRSTSAVLPAEFLEVVVHLLDWE